MRNWKKMDARVHNSTRIRICEDIEVSKKDIAYCINDHNQIISIDVKKGKTKKLAKADEGRTYGLKLSRD